MWQIFYCNDEYSLSVIVRRAAGRLQVRLRNGGKYFGIVALATPLTGNLTPRVGFAECVLLETASTLRTKKTQVDDEP